MSGSIGTGLSSGWWDGYFDERFAELYRPFLTEQVTREETAGAVEMLGLAEGSRILDLGCGWGRHARELASAGYRVTGLDLSPHLLSLASGTPTHGAAWVRGDMRALPFRGSFDAVTSFFSSLGYFLDDREELRVLEEVRRVLRPDGVFLLETMHRDLLAREYAERDWWRCEDGTTVWVERELDPVAGVSREILRWREPGGKEGEKRHAIRVRSATEWADLLRRAGMEPREWFGSWQLDPFSHTSEVLIALATPADR